MTSLTILALAWIIFRFIRAISTNLKLSPYVFKGLDSFLDKREDQITTSINKIKGARAELSFNDRVFNSLLILVHSSFILLDINAIVVLGLFIFNH